jgi:3-oxoacyl-[acyl-carrier-protein] synthase II
MIPKILVIDDDELVVKSLKNLLKRKGYEVECVNSALEAVALVAIKDFDLVISDIRMPQENGIVAVEKIKKIFTEKRHVSGFMFISGYAEEDTPAHAIRLGVDKFLYKPFDNEKILEAIQDELQLVEKERQLRFAPKQTPTLIKRRGHETPRRRVVITGLGLIAPNGVGKEDYWKALKEGKNAVDKISFFDASHLPSQMAAEIHDFKPERFILEPTEIKRMARSSHLAVGASKLAVDDAKLPTSNHSVPVSVIIGSSMSGVEYLLKDAYAFERGGLKDVRAYVGIAGFVGSISSEVSRAINAKGPSYTLSTGCTSSTDAMGYAMRQIQYGFSDVVISGGADACVSDGILAAFCRMGATSTRNNDFKKASRPFNKDRDGFVIAEGSWIFILEELDHARARNSKIYGELLGYGATCDAWHMARPHPSGEPSALAIQMALKDAGIEPEQVDVFEAYGNSTPTNDSYETGIVKKVFGKHAYKLVVPSVKSMIGHPIGAAGAAQVAAALQALNEGFIHPTINYEVPDPECDLNYVTNTGKTGKFKVALCNSLAFGGKNACLVLKSFEE